MFDDDAAEVGASEGTMPSNNDASEEPELSPDDPPESGTRNEAESSLEAAQKDADANFPPTSVQGASASCGTPPAPPPSKDPSKEKTWIEYHLVDEEGISVPGVRYRVKTPDGSMIDGAFDHRGKARIPTIDPGNCKIWLLDVDGKEWKKG